MTYENQTQGCLEKGQITSSGFCMLVVGNSPTTGDAVPKVAVS